MSSLDDALKAKLFKRSEEGLLRNLKVENGLIDFCSNDYLGLARSSDLHNAILSKLHSFQPSNGATGSRLLSGNTAYTEEVERKLSNIFSSESALIFNSGYAANLAVLSSLPQRNDTILYDELAHACIKDGARLSLAARHSFRHNDLNDLENKLKKANGKIFVAIESIYSMDGDEAPLTKIIKLCQRFDASIILDEAHSTGAYGENGSGLALDKKVASMIDVRIYTFGKAMGIHGACIAGSHNLRNFLINFARPFIYTTALPLHAIVSINQAFEYLSNNIQLQNILQDKISFYLKGTESISNRTTSKSAIQTVITGGNSITKRISEQLQNKGFDIRAILSPTVPVGTERLRICLHSFNSNEEIRQLTEALNELLTHKEIN